MSSLVDSEQVEAIAQQVRFILVQPSHPGNVGAAARALKTMGFSQLVVVQPRDPAVLGDPQAVAMASGADDVLAGARLAASLSDALEGVHWSLAMSARPREFGPPLLTPREAAPHAAGVAVTGQGVALVFGNERTGLANSDVEQCTAIAHIPANPVYSSLNLAQAIQLMAYEVRVASLASAPASVGGTVGTGDSTPIASADEIEGMYTHLQQALVRIDFLDPKNPKKLMSRLRRLFARSGLEHEEVNILRGIAKHVLAVKPLHADPGQKAAVPAPRDNDPLSRE